MRRLILCICVVCMVAATAGARDLRVTVYNSNIGVVKDIRGAELERGLNELSMDEIASKIDPTSVRLKVDGRGQIDIIEQKNGLQESRRL